MGVNLEPHCYNMYNIIFTFFYRNYNYKLYHCCVVNFYRHLQVSHNLIILIARNMTAFDVKCSRESRSRIELLIDSYESVASSFMAHIFLLDIVNEYYKCKYMI